jgi:hypothetical protein
MTLPKITTALPYEDFAVETDRTWVDWVREADDPKKNHRKEIWPGNSALLVISTRKQAWAI